MIQDILTYIIIIIALSVTIYRLYKSVIAKKNVNNNCLGCSKSCQLKGL